MRKLYYQKNCKYLFVLRNPLDRAISAFNWQWHRVVELKKEEFQVSGEFEVLTKYGNIDKLAINLYNNNELNLTVLKELLTIRHLKEDINFYLSDLLDQIQPHQIFGVITQESLNEDIFSLLNTEVTQYEHKLKREGADKKLSNIGQHNLQKIFKADYLAIMKIHELHPLKKENLALLMQGYNPSS